MFLKGQQVELRPIEEEDASLFQGWINNQKISQYLLAYFPVTLMAEKEWIKKTSESKDDIVLTIATVDLKANGLSRKPIGNVALNKISHKDSHATFGIFIGEEDYHGHGLGTEAARLIIGYAFEQLNLHRINSNALAFNERSIKMHLRLGFEKEGCQRQKIFKNGAYQDEIIFGLLRENWKK